MLKKFVRTVVGASALAASAFACAAEPVTLMDDQLDAVSAGATVPNTNDLSSIGALSWSTSTATSAPGVKAIIDADVSVHVGLSGNGASFTHDVSISH